ncbi:MAG: hypothetical protein RR140_01300 [Clostridia bacterium]
MKKNKFLKLSASIILALLSLFILPYSGIAICESTAFSNSVISPIVVNNGSFNSSYSNFVNNPSNWTKKIGDSGTSGAINIDTEKFSANKAETYFLTENPEKPAMSTDTFVLMLNSKTKTNFTGERRQGYSTSSPLTFSAYSYYYVSFLVKTQNDAVASAYLTGMDKELSFTLVKKEGNWQELKFFVATGETSQNVNIELWLGSKAGTKSIGAVFFDEVKAFQISGDVWQNSKEAESNRAVKYPTDLVLAVFKDLRQHTPAVANFDFEDSLNFWTKTTNSTSGGISRVVDISSASALNSYGIKWQGSHLLPANNKKTTNSNALVIHSDKNTKVALGYESTNINLPRFENVKITVWVKVADLSGSAYVVLTENNDILDFYKNNQMDKDFYTPVVKKIQVSSNNTNKFTNDFTPISFYVSGHNLYDTSLKLGLWLGYKDAEATTASSGTVFFDNVTLETISTATLNNHTSGGVEETVKLTTLTAEPSIKNGLFNSAEKAENTLKYPLVPTSWTQATSDKLSTISGVVKSNDSTLPNGNPGSSNNSEVENVLVMGNNELAYQNVTSSSFSVTGSTFHNLSFFFKTAQNDVNQSKLLSFFVYDSLNNLLFSQNGLSSLNWAEHNVVIRSDETTQNMTVKFALGTLKEPVKGYVWIDKVLISTSKMTEAEYTDYVKNTSNGFIDFSNFKTNLMGEIVYNFHKPFAYTMSALAGSNANASAGILQSGNNAYGLSASPNNTSIIKNLLGIETFGRSFYTISANDKLSLTKDNYYKLSVDVLTKLKSSLDVPEKTDYGAEFGLIGIEKALLSNIICNSEWGTYTIYIKATETASCTLRFALNSFSSEARGLVAFDNIKFETIDEKAFSTARTKNEANENKNVLLVNSTITENENEPDNKPTPTESQFSFLLVPSILLSVTLVIALVGYVTRKIKFHKWEIKKQNEYDRNKTLYRDVARIEAENLKNQQVKKVKLEIEEIKVAMVELENENAKRLADERKKGNRVVDRSTEKQFKLYASKHTVLVNKLTKLENAVLDMNTDEYLLTLQRKMVAENNKKAKLEIKEQLKKKLETKKTKKQDN